mmetsp:Transcript_53634/g.116929  ORF Transcript_53634/g.116929 Transcript_53634/m.116929 type:complete len:244 (-) Transcript_53634:185-916(-)
MVVIFFLPSRVASRPANPLGFGKSFGGGSAGLNCSASPLLALLLPRSILGASAVFGLSTSPPSSLCASSSFEPALTRLVTTTSSPQKSSFCVMVTMPESALLATPALFFVFASKALMSRAEADGLVNEVVMAFVAGAVTSAALFFRAGSVLDCSSAQRASARAFSAAASLAASSSAETGEFNSCTGGTVPSFRRFGRLFCLSLLAVPRFPLFSTPPSSGPTSSISSNPPPSSLSSSSSCSSGT